MIPESVLDQQMIRLSSLGNPTSVDEQKIAYQEAAKNADHASRITAWLLRHCERFPVPKEIYEAASATLRQSDMPRADKKCKTCDGTGYQHGWELVTYHRTADGGTYKSLDPITDAAVAFDLAQKVDGKTQLVYDGVRPCPHCTYGRSIGTDSPKASPKPKGLDKAGPFIVPHEKDKDIS